MGLMDKFKNLFTDEEIIEEETEEPVKIKEIKKEETKEHKLPTFMREKIEKEEKEKKKKKKDENDNEEIKSIEEIIKTPAEQEAFKPMDTNLEEEKQSKFKFPVFDESDFIEPTRSSRHAAKLVEEESKEQTIPHMKEELKEKNKETKTETKVSKLYKDKIEPEKEIKKFKTSPIISPIFGVLDKNYIPSEVETRKGDNYEIGRRSKTIDFDSVRKKAYENNKIQENDTLESDIKDNLMCENCEYLKKAKSCKKKTKETSNNEVYKASCEEDITVDEAAENYFDYGVAYEKSQDIDPIYLEEEENNEVNIVNNVNEEEKSTKKEIPPVKSSINLLSTIKKSMGEEVENDKENKNQDKPKEKDLELTDDLFNLIDSMYEERNED